METFQHFDALPLGIFVLNGTYEVLFWNRYLENWTGWQREEMVGTDARLRIGGLTRADYRLRLEDVFSSGVPAVFSPQLHAPLLDCGQRPDSVMATTVSGIPDSAGQGFLAVAAIQDITDLTQRLRQVRITADKLREELSRRQELEFELCRAKDTAERANRAKTDFLAIVSHEIRTPLHAILGAAGLLSETELNPAQRRHVNMFQRAGSTLLTIINDILDLTKIESGGFAFEKIAVDLNRIVEACEGLMGPAAARKGLRLAIDMDPAMNTRWMGDPSRIQQILLNLLGNAVKFTERGSVAMSLRPLPEPGTATGVEIVIADTGPGIQPEKLAAIFEDFTQADSSTTRRYGGTGLGLSIARRLVELMGGRIHVVSKAGMGTQFTLSLTLEPAAAAVAGDCATGGGVDPLGAPGSTGAREGHPGTPGLTALDILVAEDSEDNQILINAFLSQSPHRLHFAGNGRKAVTAFAERRFDLVLMDVQMPEMDGLEATRRIRQMEVDDGRPRTPIVAITASALAHDREATHNAGCDQHLTKPLSRERLLKSLAQFAPSGGAPADAPPAERILTQIPVGLEDLAGPFLDSRRNELIRIEELLATGLFTEIKRLGHGLKGSGGAYGFPELSEVGAGIERAALAGQADDVRRELVRMKDYLDRVWFTSAPLTR